MSTDGARAEILAALDGAWKRWDVTADQIPRERMIEPGLAGHWSYKDVVAHLMAYERFIAAQVRAMVTGAVPTPMEVFGTPTEPDFSAVRTDDDQNAMIYELYRHRSLEEVEAETQRVRVQLREAIALLPDGALNVPAPWTNGMTLRQRIAGETYAHREGHSAEIEQWRERSADQG